MDPHQNDAAFLLLAPVPNPSDMEFRQPARDPRVQANHPKPKLSQQMEEELKDSNAARKMQKADREKLRRDRLNEHFLKLGKTIDPDRPKNDKGTILADTIQLLKDLTSEVNKLKAEYAMLTEESCELTQEKNDLREEKASLKSDIENLNIQYQQRSRAIFPWAAMDHSVVMAPPSYPFPMPVPMPPGPIPMHPSMQLQPYPFFGNQNPGVISAPVSTYIPFMTPNTMVEQQSTHVPPTMQPGNRSQVSGKQDSRSKSSRESKADKTEDSNDVATDLELKTPGSTVDQDLSSGQRKSKKPWKDENSSKEGSSSSRCSSSPSGQDSSSNSIVGGRSSDVLEGKKDQQR